MSLILGIGELLWDVFADHRRIGGAPYNFAIACHRLGHPAGIVTRLGSDEPGIRLWEEALRSGMPDELIQTEDKHPTGVVKVTTDRKGQPAYEIVDNVAYDHLLWTSALLEAASTARAVCFGTLAQRHPQTRSTIVKFLRSTNDALIVFDINLRQHFFTPQIIEESLRIAQWLKLNEEELVTLQGMFGLDRRSVGTGMAQLRRQFNLCLVCLTRGANGCFVQTDSQEIDEPGIPVTVRDTVGAGDTFTAALVTKHLEGVALQDAVRFANETAARHISKS